MTKIGDYGLYDWVTDTKYPEKFFHDAREWATLKAIEKFGPYKCVLDAGCGTGLITRHLMAEQIIGLDINQWALDRAKLHAPGAEFVLGSVEDIPFEDKQFDLVVCTHTLEHLERPQKALEEFYRVLTLRGKLIGAIPSNHLLWRYRKFLTHSNIENEPFHANYTRDGLRRLLNPLPCAYAIHSTCFGMEWQFVCFKDIR